MTVREPFAHAAARRYPLAQIAADVGVELRAGELAWVEPDKHVLHGFVSEVSDEPTWQPPGKIAAKYLAPYLDRFDRGRAAA
jgi:hypothetical protein